MFSRITRDINRFGGQPFIANTNITVNQIITESLQGKSIPAILEKYSALDQEAIHQALAFSLSDVFKGVSYWRHDGMTPLTQIKGYSEILVGKTEFDNLDAIPNEQKQEWMSIIHTSCQRGIARWQQMSQWMSIQYLKTSEADIEVYQIDRLVRAITAMTQNYEPTVSIKFEDNTDHVSVETHTDTPSILGSVLAFARNTFKPSIDIVTAYQDTSVTIRMMQELIYPEDDINRLLQTPYNPFATALMFFHSQNSDFSITRIENNLIITLKLNIWHATEDNS